MAMSARVVGPRQRLVLAGGSSATLARERVLNLARGRRPDPDARRSCCTRPAPPSMMPASQVFLGCNEPSVTASVSASSYLDWKLSPSAPQPYRGVAGRPSSAAAAPTPSARARSRRDEIRAEISVLTSRVADLQAEIERRELEPSAIDAVNAAVASLSSRLSVLMMQAGVSGQAEPAAASASIDESGIYLDSCAKYASEASRMRITGRLPFGNDHFKII